MCGIAGFYDPNPNIAAVVAESMSQCLAHRGPDDAGIWSADGGGITLVHRRLSILDLSPEGHQPMWSPSKRYAIVFNGEIYNFQSLRSELRDSGYSFRGGSDTEVMLAAFEAWSVADSCRRFNGMFAFALWDAVEHTLILGRDRVGKKPLYYGWLNGAFVFGSELRAIASHPGFRAELSDDGIFYALRNGWIPAPLSIYHGIFKLLPGALLTLAERNLRDLPPHFSPYAEGDQIAPKPYWSPLTLQDRPMYAGSEALALEELDGLLRDATAIRMIADVPLGAFLSGGIDSSLTVALMQAQNDRPVKTFSIGFTTQSYDEAPFASAVAKHLGTEHEELYVSERDMLDIVPNLASIYDEPLADASQIPTYLVSKLARKHVTVALTGDGGDELFIGYNRYVWPKRMFAAFGAIPAPLRGMLAKLMTGIPGTRNDAVLKRILRFFPQRFQVQRPAEAIEKLATVLDAKTIEALYEELLVHWRLPNLPMSHDAKPAHMTLAEFSSQRGFISRAQLYDLGVYLPDDLLAKIDRASMAVALESRAPLLDYRVIEFALSLPEELRAPQGDKKFLLKKLLSKYVPMSLIDRPKMGFSVPIGEWLRGPLRSWAEDLLTERQLRSVPGVNEVLIRKYWAEHLSGARNWQNQLWTVLMFQQWLQAFHNKTGQ